MEEIWKPIPGYEGLYEASDQGRVRSVDRYCLGKDGRSEFHGGKILKPWAARGGYQAVGLRINGLTKRTTVHSLIANTFLGPRPGGLDVMHLDGNRQNNALANLKYGSRKENLNQTYQYGGKSGPGKLTAEDVHEIRKRLRAGESPVDIAKEYSVHSAAIYHIRNGTTFKWLPEEVT